MKERNEESTYDEDQERYEQEDKEINLFDDLDLDLMEELLSQQAYEQYGSHIGSVLFAQFGGSNHE